MFIDLLGVDGGKERLSVCCLRTKSNNLPSFISPPSVSPESLSYSSRDILIIIWLQTVRQRETKNENSRKLFMWVKQVKCQPTGKNINGDTTGQAVHITFLIIDNWYSW